MKSIFYILSVIITLLLTPAYSLNDNVVINSALKENKIPAESIYYIPFTIQISDKGYIYSNPKGPGIGKPLIVSVSDNSGVIYKEVLITSPIKYNPKIGEWVNIHKTTAILYIPVSTIGLKDSLKVKVELDYLFCDDNSCIPGKAAGEIIYSIVTQNYDANYLTIPVDTITINTQNQKPVDVAQNNSQISFDGLQNFSVDSGKIPEQFYPVYHDAGSIKNIFHAVILALIAGMLLNFMPCVLPVISLKIRSISINSDKPFRIKLFMSLLYSAGILFSFVVLAYVVVFAGRMWGAFFQSADFLKVVVIIIFIMGLSFAGVFIFNIPSFLSTIAAKKISNNYINSFLSGVFVTLLATPCSGPFLGSVIAWSLTQNAVIVYTVFICIGAGMSIPILILSIVAGSRRILPRTGDWNMSLEKIFSFLMMASVIYFISLLPEKDIVMLLWSLLIIAAAFWQYGKWGSLLNGFKRRLISLIVLFLLIVFSFWVSFFKQHESDLSKITRMNYSHQTLLDNFGKRPVLVVFTADWCPNCKLVEKSALYTEKTIEIFNEKSVLILVADLSNEGSEGEELLSRLKSKSIPFTAFFFMDRKLGEPICLRDIYSEDDILEILSNSLE